MPSRLRPPAIITAKRLSPRRYFSKSDTYYSIFAPLRLCASACAVDLLTGSQQGACRHPARSNTCTRRRRRQLAGPTLAAKPRPGHRGLHRLSAAEGRLRQVMLPAGRLTGSLVELAGGTNGNPSSRPLPSSSQNRRTACRCRRDSPPGQSPGKVLHRPAASGCQVTDPGGPLYGGSVSAQGQKDRQAPRLLGGAASGVPELVSL